MSCRVSGASVLDELWALVASGASRIGPPPAGRRERPDFPDAPDEAEALSAAGWLDDIAGLDAALFGLSEAEAEALDPNHRLILELAWEALEDAGVLSARLRRSRTAVYVAVGFNDYGVLSLQRGHPMTAFTLTGNAPSFAANRLSQLFGFVGPSLSVDTACSSSLTAVHMACQGLRAGECDRAIVAAAHTILHPGPSLAEAAAWLLSPSGRCLAFDERGDGTVRGEGGGCVVLERGEDARRRGARVRASVLGTAVNHRGRADGGGRSGRGGLTTPSAEAETAVIRAALADAGVAAGSLGYVEGHGGGSP